jgi:hypothetical protein
MGLELGEPVELLSGDPSLPLPLDLVEQPTLGVTAVLLTPAEVHLYL